MKNFSLSDNIFLNNFNNKNFKSTTIINNSLNINEKNYKNNNKNVLINSINQQNHSTPLNFKNDQYNKIFNNNNNKKNNKNLNESSSFQIKIILSFFPDSTEITTDLKKIINSFLLDLYYYQQNLLINNLLNSSFIQKNYFNDMKDNFNLYIIYLNISQNEIKTIGEFKTIFNNLFEIYYKIYKDNINNIQYLILKNFLEFTQKLLKKFEEKCLNVVNKKNKIDNKFLIFKKEKKNNNEINKDSKEKKIIKNKKMNICINKLKKNTEINNNLKLILLNILDQILFSKYGNKFNQIFESKNNEKNNEQITIDKLKQMINLNKIKTISEFKKKLFLIFNKIPEIIKKNSKNYKIIKKTFSLSKEILNKTYYHFDFDCSTKNPKKSKRKKNIKNIFKITKIHKNNKNNNIKKENENITNNNKETNENLLENKGTFNNKEREILLENISKLNDDGFIQLSNYLEKNSPEIIEISEIKNDLIRKMFYFNKLSLNKKEEVINFINILLTNDKNIIK